MSINYINYNGTIVPGDMAVLTADNRAFRYGDGIFETMLFKDGTIRFLDQHIARLQRSMQKIHLEKAANFDAFFVKTITEELIRKNKMVGQTVRVRLIVFRAGDGLYSPLTNEPSYVLQVQKHENPQPNNKIGLIVDVYTEFKKPFSDLSELKSNNALLYVMAGLFKSQRKLDDVLILNQEGFLCEGLSSNVFIYYEKTLYTPALNQGCVDGVMRRVVMDIAEGEGIPVVEAQISPEIMKETDEIFCTNAVQGIQWVMGYKQKRYFNRISRILQERLSALR